MIALVIVELLTEGDCSCSDDVLARAPASVGKASVAKGGLVAATKVVEVICNLSSCRSENH
jgi:hypothetical protein